MIMSTAGPLRNGPAVCLYGEVFMPGGEIKSRRFIANWRLRLRFKMDSNQRPSD